MVSCRSSSRSSSENVSPACWFGSPNPFGNRIERRNQRRVERVEAVAHDGNVDSVGLKHFVDSRLATARRRGVISMEECE